MIGFNKPRGVICYICGREYGSASIGIHLKSCIKKFELQEQLKPPHLRRPIPDAPPAFDALKQGQIMDQEEIQKINEHSFDQYNKKALVPCPGCGRTFNPESLQAHIKGCKLAQ